MDKAELIEKAETGDRDAQYELAGSYRRLDPEREKWLTRAAEAGHVEAQYELGAEANTNIGGVFDEGVRHFIEDARKWLRSAGENGHAAACMELAEIEILDSYFDATVISEAAEWYKRGRQLGQRVGRCPPRGVVSTGQSTRIQPLLCCKL